jgi:hypothetical protein
VKHAAPEVPERIAYDDHTRAETIGAQNEVAFYGAISNTWIATRMEVSRMTRSSGNRKSSSLPSSSHCVRSIGSRRRTTMCAFGPVGGAICYVNPLTRLSDGSPQMALREHIEERWFA